MNGLILPNELTFGVELECIGSRAKEFLNYNPTDFKAEKDVSLDDYDGIEFVSPIMRYNYEDLNTIKDTLEF